MYARRKNIFNLSDESSIGAYPIQESSWKPTESRGITRFEYACTTIPQFGLTDGAVLTTGDELFSRPAKLVFNGMTPTNQFDAMQQTNRRILHGKEFHIDHNSILDAHKNNPAFVIKALFNLYGGDFDNELALLDRIDPVDIQNIITETQQRMNQLVRRKPTLMSNYDNFEEIQRFNHNKHHTKTTNFDDTRYHPNTRHLIHILHGNNAHNVIGESFKNPQNRVDRISKLLKDALERVKDVSVVDRDDNSTQTDINPNTDSEERKRHYRSPQYSKPEPEMPDPAKKLDFGVAESSPQRVPLSSPDGKAKISLSSPAGKALKKQEEQRVVAVHFPLPPKEPKEGSTRHGAEYLNPKLIGNKQKVASTQTDTQEGPKAEVGKSAQTGTEEVPKVQDYIEGQSLFEIAQYIPDGVRNFIQDNYEGLALIGVGGAGAVIDAPLAAAAGYLGALSVSADAIGSAINHLGQTFGDVEENVAKNFIRVRKGGDKIYHSLTDPLDKLIETDVHPIEHLAGDTTHDDKPMYTVKHDKDALDELILLQMPLKKEEKEGAQVTDSVAEKRKREIEQRKREAARTLEYAMTNAISDLRQKVHDTAEGYVSTGYDSELHRDLIYMHDPVSDYRPPKRRLIVSMQNSSPFIN
jgi:hypothetical protein